jgi:uncharacterized protein (TIGR03086 family)
MSTQPLEQAIATSRAVLGATSKDQLDLATPCASWNVRDLINHMIGAQYFFIAGVNGAPPTADDNDFAAGDFISAFDEASALSVAAFGAEGVMEKMLTLPFGTMPGSAFIGLAITDTLTHGWDLAKATGQSTDLAPELAAGVLAQARMSIQDTFRGPEGAPFGAEQSAPAGASNADQLAAFLGRTV